MVTGDISFYNYIFYTRKQTHIRSTFDLKISHMDKTSQQRSPMAINLSIQICFSLFPSRYSMCFELFFCQIRAVVPKLRIIVASV